MKKLIYVFAFLLIACAPVHAAVEWMGGDGEWEDPSQWSTGQLPGPSDDVLLNEGTIFLHSAVTVRSLNVQHTAVLLIEEYGRLTVLPAMVTNDPVVVNGKMTVNGTLHVLDQLSPFTGSSMLDVYGSVTIGTAGEVTLDGGGVTVFSSGIYNNRGLTEIRNMIAYACYVWGSFINKSVLNLEGDGLNSGVIIKSSGSLVNHRDLFIENVQTGLRNEGRMYNYAFLSLNDCATGILNFDLLDNRWAGRIEFTEMNSSHTILNTEDGWFKNRGRVDVNASSGANALRNFGLVTNYRNGRMYLNGAHYYEILKNDDDGEFHNYGRIDIAPAANTTLLGGVLNRGSFTNHAGGTLTVSGRYDKGINNESDFVNRGYCSACNWQHIAVYNTGILTNSACGEMIISRRFENHATGVWLNDAWLRLTSSHTPMNDGFFQNTAVIEDRDNTLDGVFINNDGVIAAPYDGILHVGLNNNILQIGGLNQIAVSDYFYDNPVGNEIGYFDANNNTLEVFEDGIGLKAIYFNAELLGYDCVEWFVINLYEEIAPGPNAFVGIGGNNFSVAATERLKVYPNPSNGWINVDWPAATQGQALEWSVVNLQGQVVISGDTASSTINLSTLARGTYLLRQSTAQGGWEVVERIVLQ